MIVIFGKGRVGNSIFELCKYCNIDHILMDDQDYNNGILEGATNIVVSPGVPPSHIVYLKHKHKILGELDFVYNLMSDKLKTNTKIIAVTGTDGKSTVCWMIYSLLNILKSKSHIYHNIWLGGNFEKPFSEIYLEILQNNLYDKPHIIVLEISSFMGYNIDKIQFDCSVWTNFKPDHLNWHENMDDYFKSKAKIIQNTKIASFVEEIIKEKLNQNRLVYPIEKGNIKGSRFKGEHNEYNLGASLSVISKLLNNLGIEFKTTILEEYSKDIKPLSHRIELVKTINGINIYDDGKSTSANSLSAALKSFDQKIILIAGGSDKGDDFSVLEKLFSEKVGYAILIGQTANQFKSIFDALNINSVICESMESAVNNAYKLAVSNNYKNILFSPGCASFGMFKNRLDRVEQFLNNINKLEGNIS